MAFDFSKWAKCLPPPAASQLDDEGFNTLASLTLADITELKEIHLKPGHFVVVREAVKVLQEEHGGSPLTESVKVRQLTQPLVTDWQRCWGRWPCHSNPTQRQPVAVMVPAIVLLTLCHPLWARRRSPLVAVCH
jgi:hypothetical protein